MAIYMYAIYIYLHNLYHPTQNPPIFYGISPSSKAHLGFPHIVPEVHHPRIQRIEAHVHQLVAQQRVPAGAAPAASWIAERGPIRNEALDDHLGNVQDL